MSTPATKLIAISVPPHGTSTIVRWKVRVGDSVPRGGLIAEFVNSHLDGGRSDASARGLQAPADGIVRSIAATADTPLLAGSLVAHLEPCAHVQTFNGLCTRCTLEVDQERQSSGQYKPVVFGGRERVMHYSAEHYQHKSDEKCVQLLRERKLVLVLDIDHTLLHAHSHTKLPLNDAAWSRLEVSLQPNASHATNAHLHLHQPPLSSSSSSSSGSCFHNTTATTAASADPASLSLHFRHPQPPYQVQPVDPRVQLMFREMRETHSFEINSHEVHHCRLRPGVREFLQQVSPYFEVYIYTMGTRQYAEKIMNILDPQRTLFRKALCRDDIDKEKKDLSCLLPCSASMALIVDDSPNAWDAAASRNVIWVPMFDYWANFSMKCRDMLQNPPPIQSETASSSSSSSSFSSTSTCTSSSTLGPSNDSTNSSESSSASGPLSTSDAPPAKRKFAIPRRPKPAEAESTSSTTTSSPPSASSHAVSSDASSSAASSFRLTAWLHSRVSWSALQRLKQLAALLDSVERKDNVLGSVAQTLIATHKLFYELVDMELATRALPTSSSSSLSSHFSRAAWMPHTRHLLEMIRFSVLRAQTTVFSGVFPLNADPQVQPDFRTAQALGMTIENTMSPAVTHVIAARDGSDKVRAATRLTPKPAHVVNPNWLWHCNAHFRRADESKFPLPLLPSSSSATSSSSAEIALPAPSSSTASDVSVKNPYIPTSGVDSTGRITGISLDYLTWTDELVLADHLVNAVQNELKEFFEPKWAAEKNRIASFEAEEQARHEQRRHEPPPHELKTLDQLADALDNWDDDELAAVDGAEDDPIHVGGKISDSASASTSSDATPSKRRVGFRMMDGDDDDDNDDQASSSKSAARMSKSMRTSKDDGERLMSIAELKKMGFMSSSKKLTSYVDDHDDHEEADGDEDADNDNEDSERALEEIDEAFGGQVNDEADDQVVTQAYDEVDEEIGAHDNADLNDTYDQWNEFNDLFGDNGGDDEEEGGGSHAGTYAGSYYSDADRFRTPRSQASSGSSSAASATSSSILKRKNATGVNSSEKRSKSSFQ